MTHVDPAGRPHFLCSRRLFFSSGPLLLLLSYFLLCLGRTAADCPAVKNHGGGGCDAMIFAAAQAVFLVNSGFWCLFWMLICVDALYLRKPGKTPYVLF